MGAAVSQAQGFAFLSEIPKPLRISALTHCTRVILLPGLSVPQSGCRSVHLQAMHLFIYYRDCIFSVIQRSTNGNFPQGRVDLS